MPTGHVVPATEYDRMGCSLRRVATQTLPDAAFTQISWDTEDADTNGMFPGSGVTITIPTGGDGLWVVSTRLSTAASPAGLAFISLNIGGGENFRAPFADNVGGATRVLPLTGGVQIVVQAFMDTAAGTTVTGDFHCYRIAP